MKKGQKIEALIESLEHWIDPRSMLRGIFHLLQRTEVLRSTRRAGAPLVEGSGPGSSIFQRVSSSWRGPLCICRSNTGVRNILRTDVDYALLGGCSSSPRQIWSLIRPLFSISTCARFSNFVQKICLPSREQTSRGTLGIQLLRRCLPCKARGRQTLNDFSIALARNRNRVCASLEETCGTLLEVFLLR